MTRQPERYRCANCGKSFPRPKIFHLQRLGDHSRLTMCIGCLIDYLIPLEQGKLVSTK